MFFAVSYAECNSPQKKFAQLVDNIVRDTSFKMVVTPLEGKRDISLTLKTPKKGYSLPRGSDKEALKLLESDSNGASILLYRWEAGYRFPDKHIVLSWEALEGWENEEKIAGKEGFSSEKKRRIKVLFSTGDNDFYEKFYPDDTSWMDLPPRRLALEGEVYYLAMVNMMKRVASMFEPVYSCAMVSDEEPETGEWAFEMDIPDRLYRVNFFSKKMVKGIGIEKIKSIHSLSEKNKRKFPASWWDEEIGNGILLYEDASPMMNIMYSPLDIVGKELGLPGYH